jgi:hypothetical protein
MTFDITIPVQFEAVSDALCSAWEGGSAYWARCVDSRSPSAPADYARVTYEWQKSLYPGGSITLAVIDEDDTYTVTHEALGRALALMAAKHPKHFSDLMSGTGDASTGDIFLQLAAFGEVRYG